MPDRRLVQGNGWIEGGSSEPAGHRVGLWFSETRLLGLAGVVVPDDA